MADTEKDTQDSWDELMARLDAVTETLRSARENVQAELENQETIEEPEPAPEEKTESEEDAPVEVEVEEDDQESTEKKDDSQ